ncbi:MAG: DUF3048 domain-containing protein [Chloroflexota bacterium]
MTERSLGQPVLVSIDNAPGARPATGLQEADIIFENPVQGYSTRFVALFACDTVATVGPVRSGRWIQTDLWQQLQILPIIYGAAPYTTNYYAAQGMPYIDGNVEAWPFFSRSAARAAPYNVYMDMGRLQELLESNIDLAGRIERAGNPRPILSFKPNWTAPGDVRSVNAIEIWTAPYWAFGWRYNAGTGLYERLDSGSVTNDAETGEPLSRRTIIVQRAVSERTFADMDPGSDPPIQRLAGTGTGTVYVDGIAIEVEWSRPTDEDVTEWTVVATKQPLVLPPGPIWWAIIQTTASVVES